MSKICDRCGHDNPDWCSYCRSCGISLAEAAAAAAARSPAPSRSQLNINDNNAEAHELDINNISAIRDVVREELDRARKKLIRSAVAIVFMSVILAAGLLFGGWHLYTALTVGAEVAEQRASERVQEILDDLRGLKTACLLFHAEHASANPNMTQADLNASLTKMIDGKVEPLLPYLVTPLTNLNTKVLIRDRTWWIEYPVDDDARVRTALRDRAGELGIVRNTENAPYDGGALIYLIGIIGGR